MTEEYRTIEGYEGLYEISNIGNVRSLNYGRTGTIQVLRPEQNQQGYLRVNLHKNGKGKMFYVHRLVAMAFIPNPSNLPQINHRNEHKTDNRAENLEWCDAKYNINYGTHNQRMAEAKLGKPTWNKGKHHSEETIRKISESKKRYWQNKREQK